MRAARRNRRRPRRGPARWRRGMGARRPGRRQHPAGPAGRIRHRSAGSRPARLCAGVFGRAAARPGHAAGQPGPWPVGRTGTARGVGTPVSAGPRADLAGRAHGALGRGDPGPGAG
ncbi:hypothetical protein G6F22_021353 [Rhizopus arrhizus]|nr:hypothetical protein G6F22_021353 [Rhizopus arrhizus]